MSKFQIFLIIELCWVDKYTDYSDITIVFTFFYEG